MPNFYQILKLFLKTEIRKPEAINKKTGRRKKSGSNN